MFKRFFDWLTKARNIRKTGEIIRDMTVGRAIRKQEIYDIGDGFVQIVAEFEDTSGVWITCNSNYKAMHVSTFPPRG